MLKRIITDISYLVENKPDNWAVRFNPFWRYSRSENNIFALCSTLFILQEVADKLSIDEKDIFTKIAQAIIRQYPYYKNKDGRNTYNFYRTKPSQHFPGGYLMNRLDHFRLPDDIDDTAMISYTLKLSKAEVLLLKKHTMDFAEVFAEDRQIYNTWYGKNMPKEQDVCALLNLMYLFFSHEISPDKIDYDTLKYLYEKVDDIEIKPFRISRHYAHPALILYHYARFVSKFSSILDEKKPLIIQKIERQLKHENKFMFRLMLESSLLKLGVVRKEIDLSIISSKGFYTFIGAPLAPFSGFLPRFLASKPIFQIFWNSEVHTKALIAEYILLLRHKC